MWIDLKSKFVKLWAENGFSGLVAWAEWRLVVMSSHDVIIKVRQKAWARYLHVWMSRTEMNSRTCAVTRLPGILIVSPQGTAIHLCSVVWTQLAI